MAKDVANIKESEGKMKKSSSMAKIFKRLIRRDSSASDDEEENKNDKLPLIIVQPGEIKTSMKFMKKNANEFVDETLKMYRDIGGYDEAKLEVIEFVNFIHHKEHYAKLGAKVPKGALLYGPPGTGKTLLARATAGEGNIPFISCASASFLVATNGPEKLRKVFDIARKLNPCILFFDEIDCIGRARNDYQATPQSQSLTEELLIQLDGFEEHKDKVVIVFGATNCYEDLDSALKRPGRFDRSIEMPDPDIEARMEIARVHLAPLKTSLEKNALAKKIAMLTEGFTGAKLASLCNESAMIAARNMADEITSEHFDKALDRVKWGVKKQQPLADKDKKVAAYHDAGHAVVSWHVPHVKPVTKVSIMPSASGQFSCSLDEPAGYQTLTKDEIMNILALQMAGMASEEVIFGSYCAVGGSDIEAATKIVTNMSAERGMLKVFGKICVKSAFVDFWHKDEAGGMDFKCGDKTFELAFREMEKVISDAFEMAKKVCVDNRKQLDDVATALMAKDWLNLEDLEAILGKVPHFDDLDSTKLDVKSFLPAGLQNWNVPQSGG